MSFANAGRALQLALAQRANYTQRFPVLESVLKSSKENTFIDAALNNQTFRAGKPRDIIVNYYPPVCTTATDCSANICTSDATQEPLQSTLTIDNCLASSNFALNVADVRKVDGEFGFSNHAIMQILANLNALRKKLATDVASALWTSAGTHNGGSATKLISFTNPSDGAVRPLGMWEIEREFSDLGLPAPYIVGGADVFTWMKAVQYGSGNANGVNVGQLPTSNLFYDPLIEAAAADATKGHVLAYDPQMIKFVSYVENAGIFGTSPLNSAEDFDRMFRESGTFLRGTFQDPVTGLLFDLNVKFDDCNEKYIFNLKMHWDLLVMPKTQCLSGTVNGILKYETCIPATVTCP